uniref:Uncharacterized protein n=1 Tax=Arundo donax TaxID=35708 RepID=A0A0A8Y545_ARUDO
MLHSEGSNLDSSPAI